VLQTSHNLSDERTEYLIRDRLSFMRFLGLGLADTVPDANTIWTFRETLTRARLAGQPAIEVLFARFDAALSTAGYLAMGGQIIDASIVAAPKQRKPMARSATLRKAAFHRNGRTSPPSCAKRIATRAGRSNTAKPSRAKKVCPASISRSPPLAIKITSASTAGTV
jgi:IS5 family transposase